MSIIFLEPFIFDNNNKDNIFIFQSVNLIIYLNMASIICFIIYSLIYKMDYNMQKPPNSLIIWKMFGECLISVHLLILFLCFSLENNNSKFSYTKYIIRVISILSPIGLYITYFFTFCIAQNLYCTFHYYKNDFEIRMQKYKTLAISMGIIVIIFSIILNKNIDYNNNYNTNNKFNNEIFPNLFIGIFYFFGIIISIFIITKLIFVIKKQKNFLNFMNLNTTNENDTFRHKIVSLFIKRHLMFCFAFLICFLPNNLVILIQLLNKNKICYNDNCSVYSFMLYLISLSGVIDFCIKMTEPYMKKYFKVVFNIFKQKNFSNNINNSLSYSNRSSENENIDYSTLYKENKIPLLNEDYNNNNNFNDIQNIFSDNNNNNKNINNISNSISKKNSIEMKKLHSDEIQLNSMADTVEIVTREMQTNDFYKSLISIYLSIYEDKIYKSNDFLLKYSESYLPFDEPIYKEKSPLLTYTNNVILSQFKELPNLKEFFFNNMQINVKIRKYSPKIFYLLRKIDGISTENLLKSLNPIDNLKIIKESFATGGRSSNPIIFTHDKKFLLKTISKNERKNLIQILPEFHRRLRDKKSLLCRIYGVFRIEVLGKVGIHIIVMRNMNELNDEFKLITFDLKGSTVERHALNKNDREIILKENGSFKYNFNNNKNDNNNDNGNNNINNDENYYCHEVLKYYKKKILKDLDFDILPEFSFNFDKETCIELQSIIFEDSEFLKGFNLIDYSLLVSIYKYSEEYFNNYSQNNNNNNQNYRIIINNNKKYIFCFSIIDYLTPYNISKKFELGFKTAGAYVGDTDRNFSVLDALGYSRRFIRYLNKKFGYQIINNNNK